MFIEIRSLIKAKKYLDLKYDISSKNKLSNIKYSHLIDCLNILKFYNIKNYLRYGPAVLLHDIGRFYEEDSELAKFNHAEYGYNLLNMSSLESKYLDSVGNFTNGVIQRNK